MLIQERVLLGKITVTEASLCSPAKVNALKAPLSFCLFETIFLNDSWKHLFICSRNGFPWEKKRNSLFYIINSNREWNNMEVTRNALKFRPLTFSHQNGI